MEVRMRILFGPRSLIFLLFVISSSATCYLPNGSDRHAIAGSNPGDYLPCDATAAVSMCCAIGRQGNADVCLPGGLCRDLGQGVYWRESCTDRTWKSPECTKLFVDGPGWSTALCTLQP